MLAWRTRAPNANVARVITEVDRIVRDFSAQGPRGDELDVAHGWASFSLVKSFQTAPLAAGVYAGWIGFGLPETDLVRQPAKLAAVTAAEVQSAASRYLDADHMRIVVVGDLAELRAPLSALGFGPIEVRDSNGTVLPAARAAAGR